MINFLLSSTHVIAKCYTFFLAVLYPSPPTLSLMLIRILLIVCLISFLCLNQSRNGSLDFVMFDAPILDYFRATDHGCRLKKIGDIFVEDAYGIGMKKG